MSFLGGVFDSIGSLFGGGSSATGAASGAGIGDALLTAASSALNSPMQQPSSPGMSQFGPHQNSEQSPAGPANTRALTSEDPRQLEEQWLARMHRFRSLRLATDVPNYKSGG